jgi:hypothetical protein
MAFGLPSQQKPYLLASSLDPAFDLPAVPVLGDDATEDDVKARDAARKLRDHAYQVACDTGNYGPICKPGLSPTLFTCRPIHGPLVVWLQGEARRRKLTEPELAHLAFRLGVTGVDVAGVQLSKELVDGHQLLTDESVQQIYSFGRDTDDVELGPAIVFEIGSQIWLRAIQGVRPLS